MNNGINQKLKITGIGFDWRDIGRDDYGESKKRLDRDGLNTDTNDFLMVYLGGGNRREKAGERPKFIAWHIYFFTRLRIVYDLFLIVFLPLVLIKEKYKPDVFYATEFPFLLSQIIPAKILKSKIYFRVLNLPRELALTKGKKGKLFYLYYKIIEKITVPFVDKFIAINETTKKYLLDLGVKEEKIVMDIPDTIMADAAFIEKVNKYFIREKYNIKDKKIILSVGSLIKEKGYEELLMAFAGLNRNDMMLVVCGEGPRMDEAIEFSKKHGLNVEFEGFVRDVEKYLKQSKFVFVSRYLGILEAMINKKLVFAVYDSPIKEDYLKMSPFSKWIVIESDPKELAKKVKFYFENPLEEKKLIEEAYNWAREQTWEKLTKNYLELWVIPEV